MHGTNPKVYPNIVTTLQLSKSYDKCDHLCKLKEEVCKVAYINYKNFPTERNGAETSGSKSFSFPKLRSFWSAAGIEIDPCRWPKGSKLWEREWLKIAKICADTAGAEAIVLWTIVMKEQARCIFIHTRELICSICLNFTAPAFRWCGQMSKWWMADWPIKVRV